jgi:hypothetical protein
MIPNHGAFVIIVPLDDRDPTLYAQWSNGEHPYALQITRADHAEIMATGQWEIMASAIECDGRRFYYYPKADRYEY